MVDRLHYIGTGVHFCLVGYLEAGLEDHVVGCYSQSNMISPRLLANMISPRNAQAFTWVLQKI